MPLRDINQGGGRRLRKDGSRRSFRVQVLLVALLLGLIAGGTGLFIMGESARVRLDESSLCRTDAPPTEITAVLIDASDEFSEPQLIRISHEMQRLAQQLPRWGQLDVFLVARAGERLIDRAESICNPGSAADVNRLYQNPQFAQRRWEQFSHQFARIVGEIGQLPDTETSPIYESIQAVALRAFNAPHLDGVPKHLVIVSDLLQYVPGKPSHYQRVPSCQAFQQTPYFSQIRSDLAGVDISIFYLRRSNVASQGYEHIAFWNECLKAQGASRIVVESVYGDQ